MLEPRSRTSRLGLRLGQAGPFDGPDRPSSSPGSRSSCDSRVPGASSSCGLPTRIWPVGGVSTGGTVVGPIWLVVRGTLVAPFIRQRVIVLAATPSRESFAMLSKVLDKVRPVIDRTYPLAEVPAAIRYVESEHARAKVVITT